MMAVDGRDSGWDQGNPSEATWSLIDDTAPVEVKGSPGFLTRRALRSPLRWWEGEPAS